MGRLKEAKGENTDQTQVGAAPDVDEDQALANANAQHDVRAMADIAMPGGQSAKQQRKPPPPATSAAAKAELDAEIASGFKNLDRVASLLPMVSADDRWTLATQHWDTLVEKATVSQLITIGETLEVEPITILRAAIEKGTNPRQVGRIVAKIDPEVLAAAAEDEGFLKKLKALFPGPAPMHVPQLQLLYGGIAKSGPLIKWVVESVPAHEVWHLLRSTMGKKDLVATLDANDLWGWVDRLQAARLGLDDLYELRELMKLVGDGHPVYSKLQVLESRAAKLAVDPPPTGDEREKLDAPSRKSGTDDLKKLLAGDGALDKDKVLEAASRARHEGSVIAKDAHARKRVALHFSPDEMVQLMDVLQFPRVSRVDWLLAKPNSSAMQVHEVLLGLDDEDAAQIFGSPDRVKKLHAKLGANVHLRNLIGSASSLVRHAASNKELRTWMLGEASPQELFGFAVSGPTADDIASACKTIAKDHGFDWVYQLTNLDNDSVDLRRLALAIPDKAAAAHLQQYVITSWPLSHGVVEGAEASDPGLLQSSEEHLRASIANDEGSEIARDAAELSAAERTSIAKDRAVVGEAIHESAASSNLGYDAVRTARELSGTLTETLQAIQSNKRSIDKHAFRTFARERPASEHAAVAGDPALAKLAQEMLNFDPFNALPGLRQPTLLAQALSSNPDLLGWMDAASFPLDAIMRLGHPQVAETAAHAFEVHGVGLIKALPRGMTQDQKAAVMRIGASATKRVLHDAVSSRVTVDKDLDESEVARVANSKKPLRELLDEMRANPDPKLLLAVCNAHPVAEVLEVLADRKHAQRIDLLRHTLWVSPLTVFPQLAESLPLELFLNPHTFEWLLSTEEPVAVLRMIASRPQAVGQIAAAIENNTLGASHWLNGLPDGYGLSDADEGTLFAIYKEVTSDDGAQRVFAARFGRMPAGQWSRASLNKMWVTFSRLPDRQVEGNAKFSGLANEGTTDGVGGSYSPGTGVVTIDEEQAGTTRYADEKWQSKQDLANELGVDEPEIDRRVGKTIETKVERGVTLYRIKPVDDDAFTQTLLHETGHAVDAMLGNRTDLVWGQAGWKSYGSGDFDAWAQEMDAWSGATVGDSDRVAIRGLFEERMQSSGAISGPSGRFADLAPSDHAINKTSVKRSFIGKAVHTGDKPFEYFEPVEHNGRRYVMNHYYGRFYSYDVKIAPTLPLAYAGFAPEEFFAECYTEFYRDEKNKGGNLPTWIKDWFAKNIDAIGHGPRKP